MAPLAGHSTRALKSPQRSLATPPLVHSRSRSRLPLRSNSSSPLGGTLLPSLLARRESAQRSGYRGVLSFAPSGVLARDAAMPGLHLVDAVQPAVDGGVAAPGSGATWDDPFVGVTAPPQIAWGDALTLTLTAGPAVTHWMVYDPDDALCVEPQAGPPDALHRGGTIHLKAGSAWWCRSRWRGARRFEPSHAVGRRF